jgi:GntR family transcriptional regulator
VPIVPKRRRSPSSAHVAGGTPPWVELDLVSAVPVYLQLYRQVAKAVATGGLKEGDLLPSARHLAGDLQVHYHTVNRAYLLLRQEGILELTHRKEMRVRARKRPPQAFLDDWTLRQEALLSEAYAHGVKPEEVRERLRGLLRPASRAGT